MYFTQEPVSNPACVEAMRQVRLQNTAENQSRMLEEIVLRGRFILPLLLSEQVVEDEQGRPAVPQGTTAKVSLLIGGDGKNYLPAFTSKEAWEKWPAHTKQYMAVAVFKDYVELLDNDENLGGIVVDAFGESYMLPRAVVERLKQIRPSAAVSGKVEKIEDSSKIRLHAPKGNVLDLKRAVSRYLKAQPSVKSAYLCMMQEGGRESYLLVLGAGISRELTDGLARAAMPYLHGKPLRIMPLLSELGERVSMTYESFYGAGKQ